MTLRLIEFGEARIVQKASDATKLGASMAVLRR